VTESISPINSSTVRIFLSYARADDNPNYDDPAASFLRRLYTDLSTAGFAVWWDRESLPSRGLTFTQELRDSISRCDRLILVVAPAALQSPYVRAEWEFARSICTPITPLLRAGTYDLIPAELRAFHAPDFRDSRPYEHARDELIRLLNDPTASLGTLHGVPSLPAWYIRRDTPLNLLVETVCADTASAKPIVISAKQQTVALHGLGGIGKSVITSALSRDCTVRGSFPDGIFWLPIGQTPQIAARMSDVGSAFGDNFEEYADPERGRARLTTLLEKRAVLLILDDVWDYHHAEAFQVVGARGRVVITTRQPKIATLLGAVSQILDVMTAEEGLALIALRIGVEVTTLPPECARIVAFLDGHSLSIAIAAGQLVERGIDYAPRLLKRMEERRTGENPFSEDLDLDETDKNASLEVSLSLSYEDMSEDLRRRFRATGIFAVDGTFTEAMAAAVWADDDPDMAEDNLYALLRRGVVTREIDAEHRTRWRRHGLLRAYAHALLLREQEHLAIFAHYADDVIQQSEQFRTLLPQDWKRLDPLIAHVQEVGDTLVDRYASVMAERLGAYAWNVDRFIFYRRALIETARGRETRGLRWLEAALSVYAANGDQMKQATIQNDIGTTWEEVGEKQTALEFYQQALSLRRAIGDQAGEAESLHNIGGIWLWLGEMQKALDYYGQALPMRRAVGDQEGEGATLNNLGTAWYLLGDKHKALDYFEQALPLRRAVNDQSGEGLTLSNMGSAWDALGEKQKAMDYFEMALPLNRAVGDRNGESTTLNGMAWNFFDQGDFPRAADGFRQLIPIAAAIGSVAKEALYRHNLAMTLHEMGQIAEAIQELDAAIALLKRYNLPYSASGARVEQYEARVAEWRSGTVPPAPEAE